MLPRTSLRSQRGGWSPPAHHQPTLLRMLCPLEYTPTESLTCSLSTYSPKRTAVPPPGPSLAVFFHYSPLVPAAVLGCFCKDRKHEKVELCSLAYGPESALLPRPEPPSTGAEPVRGFSGTASENEFSASREETRLGNQSW